MKTVDARRKIEAQVMNRFNKNRGCYTRFLDCGILGILEIDWRGKQWSTGWYDSSPFESIDVFLKENEPEHPDD